MSVMLFGSTDYANIAACIIGHVDDHSQPYERKRALELAVSLSRISGANAAAYNRSYCGACGGSGALERDGEEQADPVTPDEIIGMIWGGRAWKIKDQEQARGDARLIAYNLIAQDGTDHATPEINADLVGILCSLMPD